MKTKNTPENAKPRSISLTPEEELALQLIESRRRKRGDKGDNRNAIISDALWHYLTSAEGISRETIDALMPTKPPEEHAKSNVKVFRKKSDNTEP